MRSMKILKVLEFYIDPNPSFGLHNYDVSFTFQKSEKEPFPSSEFSLILMYKGRYVLLNRFRPYNPPYWGDREGMNARVDGLCSDAYVAEDKAELAQILV